MPRKTFVAGDPLLASEMNTFLMDQSVMVFDSESARTSALPSPAEGMVTYLKDVEAVQVWDGAKWDEVSGGGRITVSDTAPADAEPGDLWFDSESGLSFVYYEDSDSVQWVEIGQAGGPTAAIVASSAPVSAEAGQLWFDAETGNLYFYYVDVDGGQWVQVRSAAPVESLPANGYTFVDTVYFTSNGTFSKGDYPWLRAIRVRVQGAGGAGGGAASTGSSTASAGGGGGSGSFAESFITDIAGLASSVTATVGAGGSGVDDADGNDGNDSSFGALVIANGGFGALGGRDKTEILFRRGGLGGSTGVGDFGVRGNGGGFGVADANGTGQGGLGGASFFGGAGRGTGNTDGDGFDGNLGGGGGGANNRSDVATAAKGGDGGDGIVIVELFA